MNRFTEVGQQLLDAIQTDDLENVRALLSQGEQKEGKKYISALSWFFSALSPNVGRVVVFTDDDINFALYTAVRKGSVESCRLLCERLSASLKEKYSAAESPNVTIPLHNAVSGGHVEIVRLLKEFNFNLNQKDRGHRTPLCYAARSLEMTRFLLEHGADPNRAGIYGNNPLYFAVHNNNPAIVRLLLEHGANPNLNRLPANEEDDSQRQWSRNTNNAIRNGNTEILSLLLQYGAFVGNTYRYPHCITSLNILLRKQRTSRETKLSICRVLVEHAKVDTTWDTVVFLKTSLDAAIKVADNDGCQILLQAGMDPSSRALYCAIQAGNERACRLLVQYGADPFREEGGEMDEEHAASPFHAAARAKDTSILRFFLELWDERFSLSEGKNSDGDYPVHVACCDPRVSLPAIQLVVKRQTDTVAMVDGEQGLLPFRFAAMWDVSLDVIYYLLQHCPNALGVKGGATMEDLPLPSGNTGSSTAETSNDDGKQDGPSLTVMDVCGPVKKKAKTTH